MVASGTGGQLPDFVWERLKDQELFKTFTSEQRDRFLAAFEHETGVRVRHFKPGELVCHKGEYELDLCFVLEGAVDFFENDASGQRIRVATMDAGNFYGELGAIGGLPRTTDVYAGNPTSIFYMPRHTLKYVEINPHAREVLADRYKERAVRVVAQQSELFRGVSPAFLAALIPHCEIIRHDLRGVLICKQGEAGDAMYIVRDGFVEVVHEREDGTHRVLAYLRTGDYFGEMAMLESAVRHSDVLTAGKCELIKVPRADFLELCRLNPDAEALVRGKILQRHEQELRITPEISDELERSGQLGVVQADALLVLDLDLCVKCDNCVKACETLHGESRLIRTGIQLGKYLVPSACRHCDDPKCMNSCPTGAIKRRPEGEIYFQYDMCIGCGNCAIACPYENIAMIETTKFDAAQAKKASTIGRDFYRPIAAHDADPGLWSRLFKPHQAPSAPKSSGSEEKHHVPPAYPIKCDLCDGLPFMGCVHNCPTGAAIRIDPATLFKRTGAVSVGSRVRKAHESGE